MNLREFGRIRKNPREHEKILENLRDSGRIRKNTERIRSNYEEIEENPSKCWKDPRIRKNLKIFSDSSEFSQILLFTR